VAVEYISEVTVFVAVEKMSEMMYMSDVTVFVAVE